MSPTKPLFQGRVFTFKMAMSLNLQIDIQPPIIIYVLNIIMSNLFEPI